MIAKPWDSRLAHLLVRPLKNSWVTPNHLITLGLIAGLSAAALYASGDPTAANWAGALYMLGMLIDHADGELAQLTGRTSRFGYSYDRIADAAKYTGLFVGIGLGLRQGPFGGWAVVLGINAPLFALWQLRQYLHGVFP